MWTGRIGAVNFVAVHGLGSYQTVRNPRSFFKKGVQDGLLGELHKKLERIDLQTKLVVHSEIDNEPTHFDVCVVSLQKGTSQDLTEKQGLRLAENGSPLGRSLTY
jgi:hypothetical protein